LLKEGDDSPRMQLRPAVHDDENRSLTIEADSETFYRSSVVELEGVRAGRQHSVSYGSLPAGEYRIRVTLNGQVDVVAVREQTARVLDPSVDQEPKEPKPVERRKK
jgi:hypothetical protein